jgi:murein DD-endopeptidase MepM/ murein hydrolase activator NlpD
VGNRFRRLSFALPIISLLLINMGCSTHSPRQTSSNRQPASIPSKKNGLYLVWPVAKKPRITQEFSAGAPHDGIDIVAPKGTRIYAPADGRVVYAGQKFQGYGKMIVLEHNPKVATIYGHCQKLLVKSGELVHKGNLIALVGKTGHATAPHLHFEVRIDKKPVNPLKYLP